MQELVILIISKEVLNGHDKLFKNSWDNVLEIENFNRWNIIMMFAYIVIKVGQKLIKCRHYRYFSTSYLSSIRCQPVSRGNGL